jgi:hypothetical protein
MKKILLVFALAAFTTTFAQVDQNTNKTKTTTITKKKVTDSKGTSVSSQEVTTTRTQKLALTDFEGKHNFETVMQPWNVDKNVKYYNDGNMYWMTPEKKGYTVMTNMDGSKTEYATIRPTSQEGYYIYSQDGENSFGYFNSDGDFIIESYDSDNDGVTNYVYKAEMSDEQRKMMKERMKKNKMK